MGNGMKRYVGGKEAESSWSGIHWLHRDRSEEQDGRDSARRESACLSVSLSVASFQL